MIERIVNILTSCETPFKTCVMGNEAIARAAIESSVDGVFAYPGTPSTEISEIFSHIDTFQSNLSNKVRYPDFFRHTVYFEYSINEKIAMEKAIAFSIGNKSALCIMKNVGMNVASDPLMSVTYQTIGAPLVIVVCDDPGCHSSSNEQDSRYWGPMASVPVFNPATPDDAFKMIMQAFELSGKIKLPVIVRTTTRVSHTRGIVTYGNIDIENHEARFERLPEHINIPARTASAHIKLLDKLKSETVLSFLKQNSKTILDGKKARLGIISSGVATAYATEILYQNNLSQHVNLLDLGLIHPFPEKEVLEFLNKGFERILILEELDAFVESAVRNVAQRNNLGIRILGKGFSDLTATGEFSMDIMTKVLEEFSGISFEKNRKIAIENTEEFLNKLPPRPPTLCAGCPHRATYYLLKLAIPREQSELIMCGDIGCFGLGALPPLKMIDTINHMGMSISMAQGLYESFHASEKGKKVVALLGDGTFFHSGLTSLVNAVYTRANILVIIFDNRTIGMTGQQPNPGASRNSKYHEIDIPPLLKGMGIEVVETIDPFNIKESFAKVNKAMEHQGVSVLVSKAPCIFLPDFSENIDKKRKIVVDPNRCNSCDNHEDMTLSCSRCYAPKSNLSRAKAKLLAEISVLGDEQLCPANICNHGFFNSILEGDYKSAIEIVRDKMLFARTCGDICHRPCELFSGEKNVVPIKKLKHFVSEIDDNFYDFSSPIKRAKIASVKNQTVAIIGAGPAGLSAAYDLVQSGYDVEIFEKENKAGGMVTWAIPNFRMDKSGFDFEAMQLEKMGVKFNFNMALGKDFALEKLIREYDSVVLAIGMNKSKTLDFIENNIPETKKSDALSFLKSFNRNENKIKNGSVILVIGGGNSAIDAARSAKKLHSSNHVIVSCVETENTMPAFIEEMNHAKDEGVVFLTDSYIDSCFMENEEIKISLHTHSSKNFLAELPCDYLITAIGQTSASSFINSLSIDENQRVENKKGFSGYKNVFVAGDISSANNMSVIGAIASGKQAATGVRKLLEDYKFAYEGEEALERLNSGSPLRNTNLYKSTNQTDLRNTNESESTNETDLRNTDSYINKNSYFVKPENEESQFDISEIEKYNLYQSCAKCNHCIDNFGCPALIKVNGKVQIDNSRCTLCGLCIDVCPNNAIKWESESEVELMETPENR